MTLPSLHLRLAVQHSLHDPCLDPDLHDPFHPPGEQPEIHPASELHDIQLSSPGSLVEIPLLPSHNHTPLSPSPRKSAAPSDLGFPHQCLDSSPTSLRQLEHDSLHSGDPVDEEPCHTEVQQSMPRLEEAADAGIETRPSSEPCDNPSEQPIPTPTVPSPNVVEHVLRLDAEIRPEEEKSSPNACHDIVESHAEAEEAETCPRPASQLDQTVAQQSPSLPVDVGSSDCERQPSKTEPLCQSQSEPDDIVDEGELLADKASDDMSRDRDTSTMLFGHSSIPDTKIARSHSAHSFKTPKSIAASSHFDKGRGLTRTLSDISRVGSNLRNGEEVVNPKRDACAGIVQGIAPGIILGEGGKHPISKTSDFLDTPETSGTMPSACKVECGSGEKVENTNVSPAHDDLATAFNRVDTDHHDASMDSSSASLRQLEPPKPSLAHSTPALGSVDSVCSSSDLDRAESGEKITGSPHEIKRTYSSSVDTLVEEDIETLTTASIQRTISVTNSDASHRTASSLLTSSNESVVQQRQFVESPSNDFDIEGDPLSASSADAEGAWREDHSFPRPHSRVKRMYSSSDSTPDSVPNHEECIEISDSVTEALANNHWDAYVPECRRCSSAIERRELDGLSRSGRLPHTGFTSSESMASIDSLPIQGAEATPLLRGNSSRSERQRRASEGRPRGGMKSAFVKKAARLLSFVLGKKNRSSKGHPESQSRAKKRSLSSFLCGRSS